MSIEDVAKRNIQEKPVGQDMSSKSAKQSAEQELARKPLGDSVKTSVKPELETAEAASALGQSLADRLSVEEDQALGAIGSFDEDRIADLLKD